MRSNTEYINLRESKNIQGNINEILPIWEANGLDKETYENLLEKAGSTINPVCDEIITRELVPTFTNGIIEDFEIGSWPWNPWVSVYGGGITQSGCA